jgi:hypothetical protein
MDAQTVPAVPRRRSLWLYWALFLLFLLATNVVVRKRLGWPRDQGVPDDLGKLGDLRHKLSYYRQHAHEFNLVFVGDSRTYCGVDPESIDQRLGSNSVNLAQWAHWFGTQYPFFQDFLPLVPSDTVVVWSIGTANFQDVYKVPRTYPIGLTNIARYFALGYSWPDIEDNVNFSLEEAKRMGGHWCPIYQNRARLLALLEDKLQSYLPPPKERASTATQVHKQEYEAIRARFVDDPHVSCVDPVVDNDEITSATLLKKRGNYVRIELDPDYFRAKQREWERRLQHDEARPFAVTPKHWNTFTAIVALFQKHNARLIVNEVCEAPYHMTARNAQAGVERRAFMDKVAAYLEQRGIPYVRVNWDEFRNDDYFDYNHLNSQGIAKLTPMLVEKLRPYVQRHLIAALKERE